MAINNGIYGMNQGMINQLMRQKENIDSMLSQYTQPIAQTIINTGNNLDFEARMLNEGEDISNIPIIRKTLFIDEANKKISDSLTDAVLRSQFYEAWDGKLPTVMSDGTIITNVGN